MKYDYWFELPIALLSLISEDYFKEDRMYANLIFTSYKVRTTHLPLKKFLESFNQIKEQINNLTTSNQKHSQKKLNTKELQFYQQVKHKLFLLQKEKAEICCSSIKFSIKMMSQLVKAIKGDFDHFYLNQLQKLKVIKLLFKILKITLSKSTEECKTTEGNEKNMFGM